MRSRHLLLVVIFASAIAGLILWTVDFSRGVRERDQRASVNSPVAHDTSGRLAPPADEREDAEDDADEESQQRGGGAPAAPPKNADGAAVEQTAHGTRPAGDARRRASTVSASVSRVRTASRPAGIRPTTAWPSARITSFRS